MLSNLVSIDHSLFTVLNRQLACCPAVDLFFLLITELGNGWSCLALALLTVRRHLRKAHWRRWTMALTGLVLASVLNGVLKNVLHRPRPPALRTLAVRLVSPLLLHNSMPSGHTMIAFCSASLVAFFKPRLAPIAYALAMLVGLSRIYLGVHFPSDVAVGAAIGTIIPWICYLAGKSWDVRSRTGFNGQRAR